jgi:hypothetical protein
MVGDKDRKETFPLYLVGLYHYLNLDSEIFIIACLQHKRNMPLDH